jgi:hypothetical protein
MSRCDYCGAKGPLWTRLYAAGSWILCQECKRLADEELRRWVRNLEGPYETRGLEPAAS